MCISSNRNIVLQELLDQANYEVQRLLLEHQSWDQLLVVLLADRKGKNLVLRVLELNV